MTQAQSNVANKISTYLMFIVIVVVGLSIVALLSAFYAYTLGNDVVAGFLVIIGLLALGLSMAVLYQTRGKASTIKSDSPKVMTTIECSSKGCGFKSVREFQRGDFVFKELDVTCQKCGSKQMITGIFKEVKEKEKTYNV
jgi:hypothetical protein